MSDFIIDTVVETLQNRITDEDFDFAEAAHAVADALRLRQQWSYRGNGAMGWQEYDSKEQAAQEVSGIFPIPVVISRVVGDWREEPNEQP